MAGRLKVDYAMVNDVIEEMKADSNTVQSIYDEMKSAVSSIKNNGYMDGASADAYVQEFNQILSPSMAELKELVDRYYMQLSAICESFAETDRIISGMLMV